MLVLNDIHIGVQRKGGTTPASQEALRNYLFTAFEETLVNSNEESLLIAGDLFDEFEVSPRDWVQTYQILQDWCVKKGSLVLVAGNHDHSPKALRVSSFEMLCTVLKEQFGETVSVIGVDEWGVFIGGSVLAHCSNQDVFNQKLSQVLSICDEQSIKHVFLHANYDNNFAAVSDHSLNVSEEQAMEFAAKGIDLIFAHEHQARTKNFFGLTGKVIVMGNQFPSSVSDCLNNSSKYCHTLKDGVLTKHETWGDEYLELGFDAVDWRELGRGFVEKGFIRIEGRASAAEASEALTAISKFRQKSKAFVISNAVKIDGIADKETLAQSLEETKSFDVWAFIEKQLTPEELVTVVKLKKAMECS